MEFVNSFFKSLSFTHLELYKKITTNGLPDSQKLRIFLKENEIQCKGSTMVSMVQTLSDTLLTTNDSSTENILNTRLEIKNEPQLETQINNEKELIEFSKEFKEDFNQFEDQEKESKTLNTKNKFTVKDCNPEAVQSLSFEFEVLHGVYKANKPDESRQKALEDAHIKCDQALDWIVDIKNTTDDFSSVIKVVTYASDTPSLANALFEVYLSLN